MNHDDLLVHFANRQPRRFAERLAGEDAAEAALLLHGLGAVPATKVLVKLPSVYLRQILIEFSSEFTAELVGGADAGAASAILAHIDSRRYEDILGAAEPALRPTISARFAEPTTTVASQASTEFHRIEADRTCADIKAELETDVELRLEQPLVVVGADNRYVGMLSLHAVVSVDNARRTARDVMRRVKALDSNLSLHDATTLPEWQRHPALAVIDRQKRLLGCVSREQVTAALSTADDSDGEQLFELYVNVFADAIDLIAPTSGQ